MRKIWTTLVVFVIAVSGGAALVHVWLRSGARHVTAPIVATMAAEAQRRASTFHTMPIAVSEPSESGSAHSAGDERLESRAAVVQSLLAALPRDVPGLEEASDDERRRLAGEALDAVLGFLAARSAGDAAVYERWATAHNLALVESFAEVFPNKREAQVQQGLRELYESVGVSPPHGGITPRRLFEDMFRQDSDAAGGAFRPTAVVVDAPAVELGWFRARDEQDLDPLPRMYREDSLGGDFWYGGIARTGVRVWRPLRRVKTLMRRSAHGVLAAQVRLVVEGASGLRVPMNFTVVRDEEERVWRVVHVSLQNVLFEGQEGLGDEPGMYVY